MRCSMKYKKIEDIPEDYKYLVQRLINKGIIVFDKNGELNLTFEMLEILKILSRADVL